MTITFPGRTIVGLWRTRTLSLDQKAQIAEDQDDQGERSKMLEDTEVTESILNLEDTKMSKIYTTEIPVNVSTFVVLFPSFISSLSFRDRLLQNLSFILLIEKMNFQMKECRA